VVMFSCCGQSRLPKKFPSPEATLRTLNTPAVKCESSQKRVILFRFTLLVTQAMGFTEVKSKEALEECSNDVQSALDWLVTNCI